LEKPLVCTAGKTVNVETMSEDDELMSAQSDGGDGDGDDVNNASTSAATTTAAATSSTSNRRLTRETLPVHRHRDRIFIFHRINII
jgi:hypothetical protein